jgi:hypothetical protein
MGRSRNGFLRPETRMHAVLVLAAAAGLLASPALAEYKPYPRAKPDPEIERKAAASSQQFGSDPSVKRTILTTDDSFEKVLEFYRPLGKEYKMPYPPSVKVKGYERDLPAKVVVGPKGIEATPSGVKVKQAFVIFDGAPDIGRSKDWVTVTSPIVSDVKKDGDNFRYGEPRKGTAIMRAQKS